MKKNKTRYAILGILSTGPMSGYDIKKNFEKISSNYWNESYGQIYPILKRLNEEGLATQSIEKQMGKPDRHLYELTQKGHEEMTKWLKEPVERHVGRHEILLKLFFGSMVQTSDTIEQVQHFLNMTRTELENLGSIKTGIKTDQKNEPHLPYWLMTVRFGELVNEALIKWSQESLSLLETMNDK